MAKTDFVGANVQPTIHTFGTIIDKTNQLIYVMSTDVVTAAANTSGDTTTGNASVTGIFSADTLAAGSTLRGGSVTAPGTLNIGSAVYIGDYAFNSDAASTFANTTTFTLLSTFNGGAVISGPSVNVTSNTIFSGLNANVDTTNLDITANTTQGGTNHTVNANTVQNGAVYTVNTTNSRFLGTNLEVATTTANLDSTTINMTTTQFTGSGDFDLTSNTFVLSSNSTVDVLTSTANSSITDVSIFGNWLSLESANTQIVNSIWQTGGTFYINGSEIWHLGNQGTGSGMDADKLDAQEGSYYRNATNINAGTIAEARLPFRMNQDVETTDAVTFSSVVATNIDIASNTELTSLAVTSGAGNVIETTANSTVSSLSGKANTINILVDGGGDAHFGATDKIKYKGSTGRVGINKAIPDVTLHVGGDIKSDGNIVAIGNITANNIIGDTGGNATTATALQTARDITLSGDATGTTTVAFDGTADVDIPVTISSVAGNLTVGGDLTINGTTTTVNSTTIQVDDPVFTLGESIADDNKDRGIEMLYNDGIAKVAFMGFDDSAQKFSMLTNATNTAEVFSGTKGTLVVDIEGNVTGALTGNASTASALATSRTISLGGDLSGSIGFDGSSNVSITATVIDDSHIHDGRYYTETEIDALFVATVSATGATFTGDLVLNNAIKLTGKNATGTAYDLIYRDASNYTQIGTATYQTRINGAGDLLYNANEVWHAGNDGTGSGLDADTLDGVEGALFIRADIADTVTSSTTWTDGDSIYLGTGNDLRVYHNATNSYIDNDTGILHIRNNGTSGEVHISSDDSLGASHIVAKFGGTTPLATLYHDAVARFATSASGATVTGVLNATTNLQEAGTNLSALYSALGHGHGGTYDNYGSWSFAASDTQVISSAETVTFSGSGSTTVTNAGNTITISSTDTSQATSFVLEDGDGTEVTISHGKEVKFIEGGGIDINWTDTSTGSDTDPYDLTFTHADTSTFAMAALTGANVVSDINVDGYGHTTSVTTRALTASDISAELAFSKNTAFNKNFANISSTSVLRSNGVATTPSRSDHQHRTITFNAAASGTPTGGSSGDIYVYYG